MKSFIKAALFINGVIDVIVGLALIFFPEQFASLFGYPELSQDVNFIIGGWGIAALTFGVGRVLASNREERYRLWAILGFFEGIVLMTFCLRYWLCDALNFMQVSVPLLIAAFFSIVYAVSYPTWSRMKN